MKQDLATLVRVQSLDQQAGALQQEISALPKRTTEIEKALESHTRKLEIERLALAANLKERKQLENENQSHEQKISKLRDQMMGAKTNEQYKAFQNEINFAQGVIRKAEDRILDLMSEAEPLDANVKAAEKALVAEKAEVEKEKAAARERTAQTQAKLGELQNERQQLVSGLDPRLVSQYERIRKKYGTAIADATDGRCLACHIALRPQYYQDLKHNDEVITCESCGRILYYNPPVSFEEEMHQVPSSR